MYPSIPPGPFGPLALLSRDEGVVLRKVHTTLPRISLVGHRIKVNGQIPPSKGGSLSRVECNIFTLTDQLAGRL